MAIERFDKHKTKLQAAHVCLHIKEFAVTAFQFYQFERLEKKIETI